MFQNGIVLVMAFPGSTAVSVIEWNSRRPSNDYAILYVAISITAPWFYQNKLVSLLLLFLLILLTSCSSQYLEASPHALSFIPVINYWPSFSTNGTNYSVGTFQTQNPAVHLCLQQLCQCVCVYQPKTF